MEETTSPETGLPTGAQPTPAGLYDFSQAYGSIQGLLEKIGQGQANLAAQKAKDRTAWENAMMDFPEGDYIEGDEAWIQQAVDDYNKKALEFKNSNLDLKNLPDDKRKELKELEKIAKNRALKAKKNMEYLTNTQKTIELDNGVNYDQGYATQWVETYKTLDPEKRVEARQKIGEEDSPYQKNYTAVDVVNKAAKELGPDVDEFGKEVKTFYNIDKIVERIEKSSESGIGKRMYERNRLSEDETPREFARRMGELAETILSAKERTIRHGGRVTSAGVYVAPDKLDVTGIDATGGSRNFTDSGRQVNTIKMKGARAGMAPQTAFPDPQNPGNEVRIIPTMITVDSDGNYWIHGASTDLASGSISRGYLLNDAIIAQLNFQYDMDIVADLQRAEKAAFDQFQVKE